MLATIVAARNIPTLLFRGATPEGILLDVSKTGGEGEGDRIKRTNLLRLSNHDRHRIMGDRRPDVFKASTLQHTLNHIAAVRTIVDCLRIDIPKQPL